MPYGKTAQLIVEREIGEKEMKVERKSIGEMTMKRGSLGKWTEKETEGVEKE